MELVPAAGQSAAQRGGDGSGAASNEGSGTLDPAALREGEKVWTGGTEMGGRVLKYRLRLSV